MKRNVLETEHPPYRSASLWFTKLNRVEELLTPAMDDAIWTPGVWLYLVDLKLDNHFYVGISERIGTRLDEHCFRQGAKATHKYGVKRMTPIERYPTREAALKAETALANEMLTAGFMCWGGGRSPAKARQDIRRQVKDARIKKSQQPY